MSNLGPLNFDASFDIDVQLPLSPFTLRFSERLTKRVTGLFGPSGSGKTSLLETLAGLNREAAGRIGFGDTLWQDSQSGLFVPPEQRRIGYVPQTGLLFPHQTVRQNILFGAKRSELASSVFNRIVDILQLAPLLDRKPHTLSGGERQRVAAGRAVCSGPQLLLMDEPLSAVDQRLRYATLHLLTQLSHEFQIPMIWVSHDAVELQAVCDELLAIDAGSVVARGTPRQVLTNPAVSSAFETSGFQNLFQCQIVSSLAQETVVSLVGANSNVNLFVSGGVTGHHLNELAWLTIPARSILIATEDPTHVSARNTLRGRIVSCQEQTKGIVMLEVDVNDRGASPLPIIVEVTKAACDRLALTPDREVYVLIKSTACLLNQAQHPLP